MHQTESVKHWNRCLIVKDLCSVWKLRSEQPDIEKTTYWMKDVLKHCTMEVTSHSIYSITIGCRFVDPLGIWPVSNHSHSKDIRSSGVIPVICLWTKQKLDLLAWIQMLWLHMSLAGVVLHMYSTACFWPLVQCTGPYQAHPATRTIQLNLRPNGCAHYAACWWQIGRHRKSSISLRWFLAHFDPLDVIDWSAPSPSSGFVAALSPPYQNQWVSPAWDVKTETTNAETVKDTGSSGWMTANIPPSAFTGDWFPDNVSQSAFALAGGVLEMWSALVQIHSFKMPKGRLIQQNCFKVASMNDPALQTTRHNNQCRHKHIASFCPFLGECSGVSLPVSYCPALTIPESCQTSHSPISDPAENIVI